MSTAAPTAAAPAAVASEKREIRIVSHSSLFYWWPVWAIGYLMALITLFSGTRMVTVPDKTVGLRDIVVEITDGKKEVRDAYVLPPERHLPVKPGTQEALQPHLRMAPSKNLGVLYCFVLLLVIVITNVPLRGLWSVIVIVILVFLAIIFALLGWWETIVDSISVLDIRINLGGYLFISTVLLVVWIVVFAFFDPQIYMVFTPGQMRVKLEIGDAETAYDTAGMTTQKQRSDLFRHWILGLGSGDLIIRTSGAQAHTFDLPNVLFLGRRVREIEDMMRQRPIVTTPG